MALEFRLPMIGVQMYTLRRLAMPLEEKLQNVALTGYQGVELFGPLEPPADELYPLLARFHLRAVSAHVALDLLESDLGRVADYHAALNNDALVVPWLPQEQRPTDAAGWRALGERLDKIGERLQERNMRLFYHNHDFELQRFDGRTGLELLLDSADPANLKAEFDLAWIVRGGGDPLELLDKYAGRCQRVHVKDIAPQGETAESGWADVGHGAIHWMRVLPALDWAGAEWIIVEHDDPADPLRSIRRSYEYLAGGGRASAA